MEYFSYEIRSDAAKLRRAYLKLALLHHPDKRPLEERDVATVRFLRIQSAYEQLESDSKGFPTPIVKSRVKTVPAAVCELGDAAEVRRLLHEQPRAVHEPDDLGVTPLMFAAKGGSVEVCQMLIDAGAAIHGTNPIGWTALSWAALYDQVQAFKLLHATGGELPDKLFILVCWTGNARALEVLLVVADREQPLTLVTDESKQSLLHLAISGLAYEKNPAEAHFRCVEWLLDVRCDVNATELRGRTVLQHNVMDKHWQTEHLERKTTHLQAIRLLCEARADPWAGGTLGQTAVQIAEQRRLHILHSELALVNNEAVERMSALMRLMACICGT